MHRMASPMQGSGEAETSIEPRQREHAMNGYNPDTPRGAFALGAVGLTALTLGALVVAPALFDSGFAPDTTLAASTAARAPIEVAITPARIEVLGARPPNVAWALPQSEPCKPQG
jgi:hypothetical protein